MLTNNTDLFRSLAPTPLRSYLENELKARHVSLESMNEEPELRRLQGEARLLRQFIAHIDASTRQARA